ncbi:MAG: FAD-dependent oxidoreductase, partial [Candidatus Brocadiales bacterium]
MDTKKALAVEIVRQLQGKGYTALLAGGCVRDMLMGIASADYDIATSASPKEVMGLFEKTIPVGAQFGVIIVLKEGHPFEVATFRSEGPYSDGRHPDSVSFCDPEGDARRRDFTINGMFYDPIQERLLDYVSGQQDIKSRLIRTIGEPHERFKEDRLRMIRAVRFACRFEYEIEEALEEGVEIINGWGPKEFLEENGRLTGILFKRCVAVFDEEGRFNPKYDEGELMTLECENALVAIGQAANMEGIGDQGIEVSRGGIKADPVTLQTNIDWVFAGGDVFYGPMSVVEAVECGKEAAISIEIYLRG